LPDLEIIDRPVRELKGPKEQQKEIENEAPGTI
jgi:hypothetical protein